MRYDNRSTAINNELLYEELFTKRKVFFIEQYTTPTLIHPGVEEIANLNNVQHVWVHGDKYYKLAHKHYGESKFWWVIAWYNKKPTEAHLSRGDLILIPTPLSDVLQTFGMYY